MILKSFELTKMIRFIPLVVFSIVLIAGVVWWAGPSSQRSLGTSNPEPSANPIATDPDPGSDAANDSGEVEGYQLPTPKAVFGDTTYDLGALPRFAKGSHIFEITNQGKAPLKLEKGPSSCGCTQLKLGQDVVPPGGSATVKLEWTLDLKEGPFSQSATIYTNDPENEEIALTIKGLTETKFGLSESELVFPSLLPGETGTRRTLLFSRTWKSMENVHFEYRTEMPGLEVNLLPASDEELEEVNARSGYRIEVTVPDTLEPDTHYAQIILKAEEGAESGTQANKEEIQLSVRAKVRRPGVKFYSPIIDGYGRIKLGAVDAQKGSGEITMNFRVDQGDTPWNATKISTFPDFIKTEISVLDRETGLFQLKIEIPPNVPKGNYYGPTIARIVIESDHPLVQRIPKGRSGILLEFHVD